jgi:CheY-like chemotaxis protein
LLGKLIYEKGFVMSSDFMIVHGEDDYVDVRVMQQVLKSMNYTGDYKNIALGQEVVDYALSSGIYSEGHHKKPDLIILDIGLPGLDGREILSVLRAEPSTQSIPIIMSSGSSSQRDYQQCIALGCNAYIQKTTDIKSFTDCFVLFLEGWQRLNKQNFF